ncbi:MAG: arginine--tRNA ligase [Chlamydiales bacterium]|nr:arginine--tRNA ligase [Chlamydiales bacterium]
MQTLQAYLAHKANQAISAAIASDYQLAEITQSTQEKFGHYQCNSALKLAKELKVNPRELAQKIASGMECEQIEKLEIAGPGFINITLSATFLSEQLNAQKQDAKLGAPTPQKPQRIIVEFSSPNIAKELHVGHLRSTIIGDAIARLFEFLGHDVLRLNHVGDWGTQFGMLITYMREEAPDVLSGDKQTDLVTLMQWYKAAKQRFDADVEFKKRSQLAVVELQSGDPSAHQAWEAICTISRMAFNEIYSLLDVKLQERGESFYNPMLSQIVNDLASKGLVEKSEGASCLFLEGFKGQDGKPFPMIIQKSDGGYNYSTTDMAAMHQRIFDEKAERIIIVTDNGQKLHFEMIRAACEKAGYLSPSIEFNHVTFGVVLNSDGKKFKSREGETEKLIDLLTEAIHRAEAIFKERNPDLSDDERKKMATILGVDAIKYADLSGLRTKDYTFSYERMLRFEGNTAAFLLYAYVRTTSILKRVGKPSNSAIKLQHPSEIALGLHLRQFGEVLTVMTRDLCPNRLADYLYELAEKFNAFFRDCHVENTPEEAERLALCELSSKVLAQGLSLLGLKTLERM